MSEQLSEGLILGIGNPLLDVVATVDKDFLKKWKLEANAAILGDDNHVGLIDEMSNEYEVKFIAGGATQNTMRIAQWLIGKPNVCVYMGAVGDDLFGKCMRMKASEEGVQVLYQVDPVEKTGHCGVFISDGGEHRSLVAFLGAAKNFHQSYVKENWAVVEKAKYFYASAFVITEHVECVLDVARYAAGENEKFFAFNLSAAYISQFFNERLELILPCVDILYGNETEAKSYAKMAGWCDKDQQEFTQDDVIMFTKKLANLQKLNANKKRIVIITQSADPVIIAWQGEDKHEIIEVPGIPAEQIVDTNGAGDAFVAGYFSQLILGKDWRQCVTVGIKTASEIIKQDGCTLPKHKADFV